MSSSFASVIIKETITGNILIYHLHLSCHRRAYVCQLQYTVQPELACALHHWVDNVKLCTCEPVHLFPSRKKLSRVYASVCKKFVQNVLLCVTVKDLKIGQ